MKSLSLLFKRTSLLAFCFATLLQGNASARLGETMEQCNARYGTFFAKVPGRVSNSGEPSYLYDKQFTNKEGFKYTIRIRIDFHNGQAWYIRYSGHMKDAERQDLMMRNLTEGAWTEPETYKGKQFWTTVKAPKFHATQIKNGENLILEMMTDECAKALADQRKADLASAASESEEDNEKEAPPAAAQAPAATTAPAAPANAPSPTKSMDGF